MEIIVDTREQHSYWKEGKDVIRQKLDTGDYSIKGHEHIIAYERKSPTDLRGSLMQGHARFKKELERSMELKHFAIVIDCSLTQFLANTFPGAKYSKVPPSVILKILCTLNIKYGIEFHFTGGRYASKKLIKELFSSYWRNRNV